MWTSLGAFGVFVGLCGVVLHRYYFVDEPPPQDSDLRVEREPVPPEENGYYALTLTEKDLWWREEPKPSEDEEEGEEDPAEIAEKPERPKAPSQSELAALMAQGDAREGDWNDELARQVIEKNQKALDELDECLKRPAFVPPRGARPVNHILLKLCDIVTIRAKIRMRAGDLAGAIGDGLRLIELGRRMMRSASTTLEVAVETYFQGFGITIIQSVLRGERPGATELHDLGGALQSCMGDETLWAGWLKRSYARLSDDLDSGPVDKESELPPFEPPDLSDSTFRGRLERALRLPNATNAALAHEIRSLIDCAMRNTTSKGLPELVDPWKQPLYRWIRQRNRAGRLLDYTMAKWLRKAFTVCEETRLKLTLLRLAVAIRVFELERGTLPAKLPDLVPGFIAEIPRDPHDGQQLRYNPGSRVVYSIGRDVTDNGGSSDDSDDDIVVKL